MDRDRNLGTNSADITRWRQWSWGSCVEQAEIMGQTCMLGMPTISNAIRQMDQSAPGLYRAKSSWSCDQWISVSPTERGRRWGCLSPQASLSLPFECAPSLSSPSTSRNPISGFKNALLNYVTVSIFMLDDKKETPSVSVRPPLLSRGWHEAPCLAQSLVHKWFWHIWLTAQSDQNKWSNCLTSSYLCCQCWEYVSCAAFPHPLAELEISHVPFPASWTLNSSGTVKSEKREAQTSHAVNTWNKWLVE